MQCFHLFCSVSCHCTCKAQHICVHVSEREQEQNIGRNRPPLRPEDFGTVLFWESLFCAFVCVEYMFTWVVTVFLLMDRAQCLCVCVVDHSGFSELCHRILTVWLNAAVPPPIHPLLVLLVSLTMTLQAGLLDCTISSLPTIFDIIARVIRLNLCYSDDLASET